MLCTHGPPGERKRHWILKFDDADMADMHFDDEDEALKAYFRATDNWTCTLYSTVDAPADWWRSRLGSNQRPAR